jgi:hypothetical protein
MIAALIVLGAAVVSAAVFLFASKKNQKFDIGKAVEEAFDWVWLPWAGGKKKFQLRRVNIISLLADGYPNTLLLDVMAANGVKKEYSAEEQVELLRERSRLHKDIAKRSMVNPQYDTLLSLIRAKAGEDYDFEPAFYAAIVDYQTKGIPADAKKKKFWSGSRPSQNTGGAAPAT